ncbi:glycosyltransferase family 4 protein [Clostridium botulinum C]|uniref:Glycosyltransferase family 4 protein n=3 Tax=Clostridium botulinum TaxID=1491 RepID=A0A9Q4TE29_CLOBO|nr:MULTISPECIES: glycosyltransferase family 4 protein [Clostridium]AYF55115.1 glycosyl transferase [Clostridium novyi]EES91084.1 glycosyltransferase [Clostridium botulinum D str. 1873]KEI06981.1 glycosyl transferase [Clostridium sp. K25]MBO3441677.1 glycosyltransferase family 4 protein [Clostridium haemolyticum]MCD3193996.1 glycosyltransferase family 4 protein [Clostridium botulinum C]
MKYCVLYPNTKNVNLIKEMGMIPYKLHKNFGYDSKIVCYNLDEYTYLNEEVKGLKIDFLDRKYNNYSLDGLRYLKKQAKNIDVLQIFHVTLYSLLYAFMYKRLNPKGKIYLKLDCSHKLIDKILSLNSIKYKLLNKYLDKVDLISVEQKILTKKLKNILPSQSDKIVNIPNGVDYKYLEEKNIYYDFSKKENIVLSVTRVGAEEKNTQMLLEAFNNIKNIEELGWKLVIVGPIEEEFNKYIESYFNNNPKMRKLVEFKGSISDRKELFNEYKRAKIFSLTSEFESFGIAFIEAAALGDVIVSTDVGIAKELISNENGCLVKVGDTKALTEKLQEYMLSENLKEYSQITYNICKENFHWDNIIKNLNENISKFCYTQ